MNNSINQLNNQDEQLCICPICFDYIVSATNTICGHSFCEKCLNESLLISAHCPICRSQIRAFQPCYSKAIDLYVSIYVQTHESFSNQQLYNERVTEFQQWKKSFKIVADNISEGDLLDVRDTEYIWCVGVVKSKTITYHNNGNHYKTTLLIHYQGWHKIYDEFLEVTSNRLAPLGCYTNRTDIPKYILQQQNINNSNQNRLGSSNTVVEGEGEAMFSYVVIGGVVSHIQQQFQQQQQQQNIMSMQSILQEEVHNNQLHNHNNIQNHNHLNFNFNINNIISQQQQQLEQQQANNQNNNNLENEITEIVLNQNISSQNQQDQVPDIQEDIDIELSSVEEVDESTNEQIQNEDVDEEERQQFIQVDDNHENDNSEQSIYQQQYQEEEQKEQQQQKDNDVDQEYATSNINNVNHDNENQFQFQQQSQLIQDKNEQIKLQKENSDLFVELTQQYQLVI